MNSTRIEALLERYYEGETTLAEERMLRDYFATATVPPELEHHRSMFAGFKAAHEEGIRDEGFFDKLEQALVVSEPAPRVIAWSPAPRRTLVPMGIAAGALLLAGLLFSIYRDMNDRRFATPGFDTEIAYADVTEALFMVSGNLNNGLRHVERISMVDKAITNLSLLTKFYQYQTVVINPDDRLGESINP